MNKHLVAACGLALTTFAGGAAALPVIPGAAGFGIDTPAGRGGTVYRVTNLNASGAGSLKACVDQSGPRVCVFEVSGTINLTSDLTITKPNITIAGQTAPSPGITLRGAALKVQNTRDVLVQHLRIRVGDGRTGPSAHNRDAIIVTSPNGGTTRNIVFDHVSTSWSTDESVQVWYPGTSDITFRNMIIGEALYNSIHPEGTHSKAMILGPGTNRVTVTNSLFAHNDDRNLLSQGNGAVFVNNVVYNPRSKATHFAQGTNQTKYSLVGNVYVWGSDTMNITPFFAKSLPSGAQIYLNDNLWTSNPTMAQWSMFPTGTSYRVNSAPIWNTGLTAMPSGQVLDHVLTNAGSRPADRDAVDNRIVNSVKSGSGSIVDSPSQVGGWPNLAVNTRRLTLPANPNADSNGNGYTNLEEWLHAMAAAVEGTGGSFDAPPAAPRLLEVTATR